jgi:deoxycytidylate deaminase
MRRITGEELESIKPYFELAAGAARKATCLRAKCGAVIIKNGTVIGEGYNTPPLGDETQRMCAVEKDLTKKPKHDKTCCVHAEWSAVLDACKNNADKMNGSTLYFMRLKNTGDFDDFGEPLCTTCSRLTMEAGVNEFVIWNNEGADAYLLPEYNLASYDFYKI